ncbi:MAG: alpha/beta hydrolase fold domain-containing protein, partial [Pseudomonadota bacterium]
KETGMPVTAVDYRLSPEYSHPAAFNDALTVVRTLAEQYSLVLCGDSAGGNLAACVCHALRDNSAIANRLLGQLLIYPGLGGDMSAGSYITHAKAPMLTTQDVRFYSLIRHGGVRVETDPTAAPLHDTDFSRLPATVVISAECDPLSDDGRHYCEYLTAAGGRAVWFNETGLVHGYLRARHSVARAGASFSRITECLKMLTHGQWHY